MLASWLRLLFLRRLPRLIRFHPGPFDLLALFQGVLHRVLGTLSFRPRLAKREKSERDSDDNHQKEHACEADGNGPPDVFFVLKTPDCFIGFSAAHDHASPPRFLLARARNEF